MERVILHCDANNFYASVEIMKNPELKGLPIAVCGDPEQRHGIVLAKSNEAKKCGVTTGEAIWQAKEKCPNLKTVSPDFSSYVKYSKKLFDIYTSYSDRVESFGLDECWIDVSGSGKLFGDGKVIADEIRLRVKRELGITVSVGVSFTKIFAKLGSDYKKPDATTVFTRENYRDIVWNLPVEDMLMVGKRTKDALNKMQIYTIGQLATTSKKLIEPKFGAVGIKLQQYAKGEDTEQVKRYFEQELPLSVGNGSTTSKDMVTHEEAMTLISALSEHICWRLRGYGLRARGVHLYIKYPNLAGVGKQNRVEVSYNTARELSHYTEEILKELWNPNTDGGLRAITVTAINLIPEDCVEQLNMFADNSTKQELLERSIDRLRNKYGDTVVKRASLLENMFIADRLSNEPDFIPFKGVN